MSDVRQRRGNSKAAQLFRSPHSDGPPDLSGDQHNAAQAAIVQSSDDAIIGYDLGGIVTSWNEGAERLFGYSANEIVGQPIATLIPPHMREQAHDAFRQLQSGARVASYETVRRRKDGSLVDVSLTMSAVKDRADRMIGASKIVRDNTEAVLARQRQSLVVGELKHRIQNLAAIIQALGRSALPKNEPATEQFFIVLMGRVRTLLSAGETVIASPKGGAGLDEIAELALKPFTEGNGSRIRLEGPQVLLSEHTAGGLALAFHELATNAVKYGALKDDEGSIDLTWTVRGETVRIVWKEHTQHAVGEPARSGFGSRLIQAAMASERDGKTAIAFSPDGLKCVFEFAVRNASQAKPGAPSSGARSSAAYPTP